MRVRLSVLLLVVLAAVVHAQDGDTVGPQLADPAAAPEAQLTPASQLADPAVPQADQVATDSQVADPAISEADQQANDSQVDPAGTQAATFSSSTIPTDFQKMCQVLGPLTPLRTVKPRELCSTAGFNTDTRRCAAVYAIEGGLLAASQEVSGGTCNGGRQTPPATTSLSGTPILYSWSDQRPLPTNLPASLLTSEGASYYWLYKNLLNFEWFATCAPTNTPQTVTEGIPKTGNASTEWIVPPGWTVHSTIWQPDGTKTALYWPFSTVIYKGNSVAVLIRGTATAKDWDTNFDYKQIPGSSVEGMDLPGNVHQGFAKVASSLWETGIKSALRSLVKRQSTGTKITRVYMVGHSLGAALTSLVSYTAQDYLGSLKIDTLLIASPQAGDPTFVAAFNKKVNARRLPFLYDLVPQIPCAPTMIKCSVPGVITKGLWNYSPVGGTISLLPSGMPVQSDKWALLQTIYPCQIGRFIHATHTCSYQCYLSQFAGDTNNLCMLWKEPASTPPKGSYCNTYPVSSGFQYPYDF